MSVALAAGCGSSGDSSSGTGSTNGSRASTANPTAPAGASAQSCAGAVAGVAQLTVTGVGCDVGRGVAAAWDNKPACSSPAGASRYACGVFGGFRCLGAATERGVAVGCARPNGSIAFIAKRG